MKIRYLLPIFVVAGLVSQAQAEHCSHSGSPAFCQWGTGCYTINTDYDSSGNQCTGTPACGTCAEKIAACEADGSVYTGVKSSALNADNSYGKDVKCKDVGGAWKAGKPESNPAPQSK